MIVRRTLSILALALVAASCSGSDAEAFPPISSESGAATSASTEITGSGGPIDQAEVARLWEQLLSVFEASADDRGQVAAELPAQLPVDEALRLSELYFVTGDPLVLTSNAIFSPQSDGSVEIVDCTDSSGPSVMGPTTAGFTATAELSQEGQLQISELEAVRSCVQRIPAQAALDGYELFRQANEEFWTDPRIDHPAIGRHSTEKATETFRAYLTELDELDRLDDTVRNNDGVERGVEVVGYLPDEIRLRVCEHGDETTGIFNAAGERTDLAEPPWRSETTVRMKKVGGEWLFDEVISRVEGDCQMGTSQFGLQLL